MFILLVILSSLILSIFHAILAHPDQLSQSNSSYNHTFLSYYYSLCNQPSSHCILFSGISFRTCPSSSILVYLGPKACTNKTMLVLLYHNTSIFALINSDHSNTSMLSQPLHPVPLYDSLQTPWLTIFVLL